MPYKEQQPNFYELLGIPQKATLREIKQAYRKIVWKYHPDVNPNADPKKCHQMMCMINEGYLTLSDIESRMEYDQKLKEQEECQPKHSTPQEENTEISKDRQPPQSPYRYSESPIYYETYKYYNTQDFNYYEQEMYIKFIEEISGYYIEYLSDMLKKGKYDDIDLLEKLISLFSNIINKEKTKHKKRTKSNRL